MPIINILILWRSGARSCWGSAQYLSGGAGKRHPTSPPPTLTTILDRGTGVGGSTSGSSAPSNPTCLLSNALSDVSSSVWFTGCNSWDCYQGLQRYETQSRRPAKQARALSTGNGRTADPGPHEPPTRKGHPFLRPQPWWGGWEGTGRRPGGLGFAQHAVMLTPSPIGPPSPPPTLHWGAIYGQPGELGREGGGLCPPPSGVPPLAPPLRGAARGGEVLRPG